MQAARALSRRASKPAYSILTTANHLQASKRFLNTETAPLLYTARATVKGGRDGHVKGSEGLDLGLGPPNQLGGDSTSGSTNAEELFAAGYGACFQSAMNLTASKMGISLPTKLEDNIIETSVHMVGDLKKLDLGMRVDMEIKVRGVAQEDLEKVVANTEETCPYSRATKGNMITNIKVVSL